VIYASKAASIVTNGSGGGKNIHISDNVSYGPAKNVTDFVVQLNGTQTIESNNKILAKAAYPGDKAFGEVGGSSGSAPAPKPPAEPTNPVPVEPDPTPAIPAPVDQGTAGKFEPGKWVKVTVTDKVVNGTAKSEAVKGTDATETIDGKGGDDVMTGLKGHDTYRIDSAGDRIVEQSGHGVDQVIVAFDKFTLPANVENATIVYSGNAVVTGNAGDNWIIGGKGADTLNGAGGKDLLTGGAGNDAFVFTKDQLNGDQVTDFTGNGTKAGDVLRFEGFGKDAKLSHTGDVWTLKHAGGAETFRLVGVTELAAGDTQFV
jgi:Ca2+-binding RTX toxin-like protein